VLHVADLYDLVRLQLGDLTRYSGGVYNVGGGRTNSVSLAELTALCRVRTNASIAIDSEPQTSAADVPYYVTDNGAVTAATGWSPSRPFEALLDEVFTWLREHRASLEPVLSGPAAQPTPATPTVR
jgi:CDP-paratose 2-epimerase